LSVIYNGDSLEARVAAYRHEAAHNEAIYAEFTRLTDTLPFLKEHRDFVEKNQWGFGDRAFHYMWLLILKQVSRPGAAVRALEIGVYKGQVVSLWALIGRHLGLDVDITGISPFAGNVSPVSKLRRKVRTLLDAKYRAAVRAGNLYAADDYLARVNEIFSRFQLDRGRSRMIRGYSTDPQIIRSLVDESFDVLYIDGDHSYEGVVSDIRHYGPLVRESGFLVVDDAGLGLPGNFPYKGREGPSRACAMLPALGFTNVLNVGHDRIYRRDI
jgi:hypothetical protein